jgi:SAM-dependent methyltransferase
MNVAKFNQLVIDSTNAKTALCDLGIRFPTDKSPYNIGSSSGHRHPYTAVYDLLFASLRYKDINFGEIGIEYNQSMICWRNYFTEAKLWGWEFYTEKITAALKDGLLNTTYLPMNVNYEQSIIDGFENAGVQFDILIDDSTHKFEDQIRVAKIAHRFVKPGGFFVIEDIFRNRPEDDYARELADITQYYDSITFVNAEHVNKYSPDWDNDKLLVMVRNNK